MDKFLEYIESVGGSELARRLGVTRAAVSQWKRGANRPNWKQTKRIVDMSEGRLKLEDVRPDIYG